LCAQTARYCAASFAPASPTSRCKCVVLSLRAERPVGVREAAVAVERGCAFAAVLEALVLRGGD
jgi:hypothetical protein